jgi:hypothetical protein
MTKSYLYIFIILLVSILIFTGCEESSESSGFSDGTLTATLTSGPVGEYLCAYVYPENSDPYVATNLVAVKVGLIPGSGDLSLVLENDDGNWEPDGTTWTGSGGTTYDVYIYTDPDTDGDNNPETGPGSPKKTVPWPIKITIDGDMAINTDYADMVDY